MASGVSKLLVLVAILFQLSTVHAETLSGRVVGVSDGDTVTLLDSTNTQYKIRLSGIDAPEKKQAFGQVSKESLSDLIYNKPVLVDWNKQDRYGRIVGKILLGNRDVNLEQVKRGLAWHYTKYQKEQPYEDRESYFRAQKVAEGARVGLWKDGNPIPPWDFRKKPKAQDETISGTIQ